MEEEQEEEKKKQIHKLLSGFLELKTEKEAEKTDLNALQIDIQWRDLMREATSKELQTELQFIKQAFVMAVDYKDSTIGMLQTDLDRTEMENMWVTCEHMNSMNELIELHHRRSQRLLDIYEEDLKALKTSYKETREDIEKNYQKDCSWHHDMDFIEQTLFNEFKEETAKDFLLLDEEITQEIEKERTTLLKTFDSRIQVTWKRFQAALLNYLEDANALEKTFEALKEEYEATLDDAENDIKIHKELKNSIPLLKAQIEERKKDHTTRVEKTRYMYADFYKNLNDAKDKIASIRKSDKAALTQLITNSSATIRELKRLVSKGEKIMRLNKRIKRLEEICGATEKESLLTADELQEADQKGKFALPNELAMGENCKYLMQLENFWERHNTVVLKNLALKKELYELELYKRQLESEMNTFMQTIAEGATAKALQIKAKAKKPLIQEASTLAKNL